MKININDVKDIIEFRKDLSTIDFDKLYENWDEETSLLEEGLYYTLEDFNKLKEGFIRFQIKEMDKDDMIDWLSLVTGALFQSMLVEAVDQEEYLYLIYYFSEFKDALMKTNDEETIDEAFKKAFEAISIYGEQEVIN